LLGKAFFTVDATQRLGLTFERQRRRQDTEVYSARAAPLASTSVIDLDTRDHIERDRVSLEHRFADLNAAASSAPRPGCTGRTPRSASSRPKTATRRPTARATTATRPGAGLSTLLESNLDGALNQRLTYGAIGAAARSAVRDGTVAPYGETFRPSLSGHRPPWRALLCKARSGWAPSASSRACASITTSFQPVARATAAACRARARP
jgi:hemoglobin/transferrin/lactoferrin receptor protein